MRFLLLTLLLFLGCTEQPKSPTIIDKRWKLCNANVYIHNITQDNHIYYKHFNQLKDSSNLNIVDTSPFRIDQIEKNMTWLFDNDGKFHINNQKTYNYKPNLAGYRIFKLKNGSARPIVVEQLTKNELYVKIHEAYGSIDTTNYKYFTILHFVKNNNSCNKWELKKYDYYEYKGIFNYNNLY